MRPNWVWLLTDHAAFTYTSQVFVYTDIVVGLLLIIGALAIVLSICSMAEVIRKTRMINLALGTLSLLSTLIFD